MSKIGTLVKNLLADHGGGRNYFDNLDFELRAARNVSVVQEMFRRPLTNVAVSGRFGFYLLKLVHNKTISVEGEFVYFCGGLRYGKHAEILSSSSRDLPKGGYTFVDDTFYKGRTLAAVDSALKSIGGFVQNTVVAYDGSQTKRPGVKSLFRYYENRKDI